MLIEPSLSSQPFLMFCLDPILSRKPFVLLSLLVDVSPITHKTKTLHMKINHYKGITTFRLMLLENFHEGRYWDIFQEIYTVTKNFAYISSKWKLLDGKLSHFQKKKKNNFDNCAVLTTLIYVRFLLTYIPMRRKKRKHFLRLAQSFSKVYIPLL